MGYKDEQDIIPANEEGYLQSCGKNKQLQYCMKWRYDIYFQIDVQHIN